MVLQCSYHPGRDLEAEYVGVLASPPPTEKQLIRDDPEVYKATLRSLITTGRAETLLELRKEWQRLFPSEEIPPKRASAVEASDLSPPEVEVLPPSPPQVIFHPQPPRPTSFFTEPSRETGAGGEAREEGREGAFPSCRYSGGCTGFHGGVSRGRKEVKA